MNCYQKLATILVFKTHLQSIGLELKALTPTKTENKTTKILFELRFHGKLHFYQLSPKKCPLNLERMLSSYPRLALFIGKQVNPEWLNRQFYCEVNLPLYSFSTVEGSFGWSVMLNTESPAAVEGAVTSDRHQQRDVNSRVRRQV